jgi:hypothetical protein
MNSNAPKSSYIVHVNCILSLDVRSEGSDTPFEKPIQRPGKVLSLLRLRVLAHLDCEIDERHHYRDSSDNLAEVCQ